MCSALAPVLTGIGVGLVAAFWFTQFLSGLLFQVTPHDLSTTISVTGLMLLVAIAAAYLPARRASRVDPMTALRAE